MDKQMARQMAADIQQALAGVASKYGMTVAVRGGSFDTAGMYRPRIEFAAGDFARKEFERYAGMFGLKAEHYGATFTSAGTAFKVTGLRLASRKRPVLAARVSDGKEFVFPIE